MESTTLLIVIVIYNEDFRQCKAFTSLKRSVKKSSIDARFFIYDNSAVPQKIDPDLAHTNLIYVSDTFNSGISVAYNSGARFAREKDIPWILFSDQDSEFEEDAVIKYLKAVEQNPHISVFSPILRTASGLIVSPSLFRFHRGFPLKEIQPGFHSFQKYSPLNSGICISVNTFVLTGGYNELVKLDYSDFAFVKKLKKVVDGFFVIPIKVSHNLSSAEKQTADKAEIRFKYFCEGALQTCESFTDRLMATILLIQRGVKLSLMYNKKVFFLTAANAIIRIK